MALDIDPPRQILTHGHWTLGHRKMSKSLGNVVNPFFALDRFGQDPLRYFMIRDGRIQSDAAYDNSFVVKRYRTELAASLGNLLRRINTNRQWDLRSEIATAVELEWRTSNDKSQEHIAMLSSLPDEVAAKFKDLDPSAALERIVDALGKASRTYLSLSYDN